MWFDAIFSGILDRAGREFERPTVIFGIATWKDGIGYEKKKTKTPQFFCGGMILGNQTSKK